MNYYAKRYRVGLQQVTVEYTIGKRELSLPKNRVLVTKLQLKSLELENQETKLTICALNVELTEARKMLSDNQTLVSAGAQLSKLKQINKLQSSLSADRFNAMDQAVIPKASLDTICLGGGLIFGGLLASPGINDNNIISGILN